jgi:hypothetical protein
MVEGIIATDVIAMTADPKSMIAESGPSVSSMPSAHGPVRSHPESW